MAVIYSTLALGRTVSTGMPLGLGEKQCRHSKSEG